MSSKEIGLVPKLRFPEFSGDWDINKVGNICDFIVPGRNKPKTFIGNIPWITTPDINHNGVIYYSKQNLAITKEQAKNIGSKIVPKNSIIISCVGDLGLVAVAGVDMVLNQQLHAFIPKENIYYIFLLYELSVKKPYMEKVATKTAVPYMNKDNCNSIPISYPTILEQQKIADCLSSLDELITMQTEKLKALKKHKKGLMQELFPAEGSTVPKLRFPEFNGDWGNEYLDNLTTKISDGIHTTPIYDDSGYYYFINGNNLVNGLISLDKNTKRVSEDEYKKHKRELNKNTILLSINGTIGNISIYNNEKVILGKSACYININDKKCNKNFIIYFLQIEKNKNYFDSELTGSTIKNLSLKTIKNTVINLPSLPEQKKIADCLSSLDEFINLQSKKIASLKEHKKGMMQQLFPSIDEIEE